MAPAVPQPMTIRSNLSPYIEDSARRKSHANTQIHIVPLLWSVPDSSYTIVAQGRAVEGDWADSGINSKFSSRSDSLCQTGRSRRQKSGRQTDSDSGSARIESSEKTSTFKSVFPRDSADLHPRCGGEQYRCDSQHNGHVWRQRTDHRRQPRQSE